MQLMQSQAGLGNCMGRYATTCKLMELQAGLCYLQENVCNRRKTCVTARKRIAGKLMN